MWIQRVELSNFKAYQEQTFDFQRPSAGKNLVLIGGMNGQGKTTLLEALYLCLYGEEATTHMARAGLQEQAYARFLQNALHGRPSIQRIKTIRVSVTFMETATQGYIITRKWHFGIKGELDSQEAEGFEIRNGVRGERLGDVDEIRDVVATVMAPANLAPFFFFDGEEVKKLADQDRSGWVKTAMEGLFGVVLLRNLRERLGQYQNTNRQRKNTKSQEELDKIYAELEAKKSEKSDLEQALSQCKGHIQQYEQRQRDIQEQLIEIGAGDGNLKSVNDIIREEQEKNQQLKDCEKELSRLLSEQIALLLPLPALYRDLRTRLTAEKYLVEWQDRKRSLEPEKLGFVDRLMSSFEVGCLELSRTQQAGLKEAVTKAWEGLFSPQPKDCADKLLHTYLEPRARQRLEDGLMNLGNEALKVQALAQRKAELQKRLMELKKRRIQLEGVTQDGTFQRLQTELSETQKKLNELSHQRGDLERQITTLASTINDEKASYEREHQEYLRNEPIQSKALKARRIINLIEAFMPPLFAQKIDSLSAHVTQRFKELAHKKLVERIKISADGTIQLFDSLGSCLKFDRSAGENQIFATALIAGLADASGYHIPLVVDTPLARLDSQHRANLLRYWCSDPDRQVILLSQDKEIDAELAETLKPFLLATYLLESHPIGKGYYRTTARRNAYFGGQHAAT